MKKIYRVARERDIQVGGLSADQYGVIATADETRIFVSSLEPLLEGLESNDSGFEEDNGFPKLILSETDNPAIYFDRREKEDFVWCSPVQTYLKLSQGSKREQDVAKKVRKKILDAFNERS